MGFFKKILGRKKRDPEKSDVTLLNEKEISDQPPPESSHPFQPIDRVSGAPWNREKFYAFIENETNDRPGGQGILPSRKVVLVSEDGLRIEEAFEEAGDSWCLNRSSVELKLGRWTWFEFVLGGKTSESNYIDVLDACAFELLLDKPFDGFANNLGKQVGGAIQLADDQKDAIRNWFTTGGGNRGYGPQWQRRTPRVQAVVGAQEESTFSHREREYDTSHIRPTTDKVVAENSNVKLVQHENVRKKTFLPECFLCKERLEEVEDWGSGLQGGDIFCDNCKEKYQYSISKSVMTLRRAIVPVEFEGEVERSVLHANSNIEEDDIMRNDHEMLSILKRLCNAYAQDDPMYKELEPLATKIGQQLNEHGGINEMRRLFAQLQNIREARTLEMHWGGIGEWRG